MVRAALDDGQELRALNEIFVGHRTHQSARYELGVGGVNEHQSSSGLIVATGTGATGWAQSINRQARMRSIARAGVARARVVRPRGVGEPGDGCVVDRGLARRRRGVVAA